MLRKHSGYWKNSGMTCNRIIVKDEKLSVLFIGFMFDEHMSSFAINKKIHVKFYEKLKLNIK